MSPTLFPHRRTRRNRRPPDGGTYSSVSATAVSDSPARPIPSGVLAPKQKRITKHFVVTSEGGARRPKTVITINSSYRRANTQKASVAVDPPRKVESAVNTSSSKPPLPSQPPKPAVLGVNPPPAVEVFTIPQFDGFVTPFSSPKPAPSSKTSTIYEDAMESFGIDVLNSPASTLNECHKPLSDFEPQSGWTATSSDDTLQSVGTVVDDGLSPWGSPKVMEPPCDGDEEDEFIFENEAVVADLDYKSASFAPPAFREAIRSPRKLLPSPSFSFPTPKSAIPRAADSEKQKLRADFMYVAQSVSDHRARQHKAKQPDPVQKLSQNRQTSNLKASTNISASLFSLKGIASSFVGLGSWI